MSVSRDNTSFDVSSKRMLSGGMLSVSEQQDVSGGEFSTSESHKTSTIVDDSMKLLRCAVSSLLCFFRATFSYSKGKILIQNFKLQKKNHYTYHTLTIFYFHQLMMF